MAKKVLVLKFIEHSNHLDNLADGLDDAAVKDINKTLAALIEKYSEDEAKPVKKSSKKTKAEVEEEEDSSEDEEEDEEEAPKKRGRPKKVVESNDEDEAPKKRGRPKKVVEEAEEEEADVAYADMKKKDLRLLCSERGLSFKKADDEEALAALLEAQDKLARRLAKKELTVLLKLAKKADIEVKIDNRIKDESKQKNKIIQQMLTGGYSPE